MELRPEEGIAVVTGGGAGLGRALVLGLCEKGFRVVALGRTRETLEETVSMAGDGATAMQLDIADPEAVRTTFQTIVNQHGPISLLINNAAVYPHRDLLDETAESYFATSNVNFGGVVACSLAALDGMANRGRGRILNVATFAGENPLPGASAYSVSKGAARVFTRAMISDLSDRFPEIVISEWMPGMLKTQMGVPNGLNPEIAAKWGVELALKMDQSFNGSTFEMGTEILPATGLKGKIKNLILMRKRQPRTL